MEKDTSIRKPETIPHVVPTPDFENYLPTAPILSSREIGWKSVMVRTYHELSELEETYFPGGPDIYLIFVTSGAIQVDERKTHSAWISYPIHAGDWFLTPAGGEPYALRWKSLSSDPLKTIHLHLDANLFSRTLQQVVDRDPTHVAVLERTGFQDPLLEHLGLNLQQELQSPTSASALYAETAAQMLAVHLMRYYTTTNMPIREYSHKLPSQQIQRLTTFIIDHLNQNLSLEVLAQQVGFSPYHFARVFRQTTGESPHQFVLHQRLAVAQRLLKETNLPLAQVASDLGFPQQSHFTHVFKRHLGMTPHAYRQVHQ